MNAQTFLSLLAATFFLPFTYSFSQSDILPIHPETGMVTFVKIEESKNTKVDLFKNAQTWIAKTYGDYKSVIQFEDKFEGRLIIKGISPNRSEIFKKVKYSLTIDCKDNKYRTELSDLEVGMSVLDDPIRFTKYSALKKMEVGEQEHNTKIALIEEDTSSKKKPSKRDLEKLERARRDLETYKSEYVSERQSIKGTIENLFASLNSAMQKKTDF